MSKMIAGVGRRVGGGPICIEWSAPDVRSVPRVVDSATVGDMRIALIRRGDTCSISIIESIQCDDIADAQRKFAAIVSDEAERRQVTVGGPGEAIDESEIPF